jgi:hypothetical protein
MKPIFSILVALALCLPSLADAQRKNRKKAEPKPAEVSLDAFSFRNVGPAFYLDVLQILLFTPTTKVFGMLQ